MPSIMTDGRRLEYTVHGEGEPVLLINGCGGRAATWRLYQVPALVRAGYQVVTFDNRGTGPETVDAFTLDDMVADTLALITGAGLTGCRVIGVSMGAMIAQELALAHPEAVRQVILLATRGRTDVLRRAMVQAELDGGGLSSAERGVLRALLNLSPLTLADDRRADDWLAMLEQPVAAGPGYRSQLTSTLLPDRLAAYRRITTPALVVSFADDVTTPEHLGREVAEAIPGARHVGIPGCGHLGFLENPDAVNDVMLTFLREGAATAS
ncbi:alpha/beta fold hydrolase [Actinoplanes couchii]|uniref:Hydrolase n=1 Tax=Actinoplanes couchii TaxID=403638 RepID=A0ABQ3XBY2_9ACTN|nr:alpha/beta hydrolase [Actinoplanes couchii]MDR6323391.1 pimeloyl-ACP methyl ester carboxylesterase [Actinoplanes couchii]GID55905.1 hydrolase [Actinoplanes couchii]